MYKSMLLVCGFCCVFLTACHRPAEENKSKFPRKANIEKYVQKAKDATRIAEERKKPLPVQDLINSSVLTNTAQKMEEGFLKQLFDKNKTILEKRLLEAYGQKTSEQIGFLMQKHTLQAQQAAKEAASTEDLSKKLTDVLSVQEKELKDFIEAQKSVGRLTPDQQLLDKAKVYLSEKTTVFLTDIALYQGEQATTLAAPVLDKAVQDYVYAMASAADEETLQQKIDEIATQAEAQIDQINTEHADPLGVTEEEKITSLRAEMITLHQTLESYVEPLYGKEAVLQMRKVFNEVLDDTGKTLRENKRLSQKKQALDNLNATYRQAMLDLQNKWNQQFAAVEEK